MSLAGKVCVVTGASRGVGKGIALQLGEHGAKVYITGRTLDPPKDSKVSGSLRDTATEIEARGGSCIPVQCDHGNDDEVERLFEQIKRENDGQLDILVNNAYAAIDANFSNIGKKFYELPDGMWDHVNRVGLRNNYLCSVYAARMMVPRKQGLIVNISSPGGMVYFLNVPYGVGKEACDRMAADCALELRESNVAFVSLSLGAVYTDVVATHLDQFKAENAPTSPSSGERPGSTSLNSLSKVYEASAGGPESPDVAGLCIVGLATDPHIMKKSGRVLLSGDLISDYGLTDKCGSKTAWNFRQLKLQLVLAGYTKTAKLVPAFVRIPKWMLHLSSNKM